MVAIRLDITDDTPPDGMKRAHSRAMTRTYETIGQVWASDFLPLHLQPGADGRYGYSPRAPSTIAKKERLAAKGFVPLPVRALVDRGRLLKEIEKPAIIRGFPSRAQVRVRTPVDKKTGRAYVLINPRDPRRPNLYRELATVIDPEKRAMEEAGREEYQRNIVKETKQRGRPRKTKIT